ncbi:MAG: hypothetical protein ACRC44_08515 [Bifidobacterium asteroides]
MARFQEAGVDLVHEGVTTLILEGVYLVWWVKIACANRGKGGPGWTKPCPGSVV